MLRKPPTLALTITVLVVVPPLSAQCNSDPVAVDDVAFYEGGSVLVVDVLANDVEPDGEALAVGNLSTTCAGTLSEDFGLVTLAVTDISSDCTINYRITDESGRSDTGVVSVSGDQIFSNGFETGDTSRWSGSQGRSGK